MTQMVKNQGNIRAIRPICAIRDKKSACSG
jgi:hypothetical protein